MDADQVDLLIVLVAGVKRNSIEPNEAGKQRIKKAIELAEAGKVSKVLLLGGDRGESLSIAICYQLYIMREYPTAFARFFIDPEARATCTNRDLVTCRSLEEFRKKRKLTKKTIRVGVVSYDKHVERAMVVLQRMKYTNLVSFDSSESSPLSSRVEAFLIWVTKCDAGWRHLGLPLALLSRVRMTLSCL